MCIQKSLSLSLSAILKLRFQMLNIQAICVYGGHTNTFAQGASLSYIYNTHAAAQAHTL